MYRLFALCLFTLVPAAAKAQAPEETVVISDIGNFWAAYDAISATSDAAEHYRLLDALFLEPGTAGLHALMERRNYTPASYVEAILEYPRFWASIRRNTLRADEFAEQIELGVERLRSVYPALRSARTYMTMGVLMTGGTTLDSLVLIGSEVAMGDTSTVTDELPARLAENLRRYYDTNPIEDLVFLTIHEQVHTQQGPFGSDLLSVALQEGVAEFVSVLATGRSSPTPAVEFGAANDEQIRTRFSTEMFSPNWNDWLYNDFENDFRIRDLGYYVGYAIAEQYYARADNKADAVAQLIELDYTNPAEVDEIVKASRYFSRPLSELRAIYERNQPRLVGIAEFENGSRDVDPATHRMTLTFSSPMNPRFRGFDYGPLGEDHVLRITRFVGISDDRRTVTVEIELQPGHRHQLTLTSQFRDYAGRALEPTVIDISTRDVD